MIKKVGLVQRTVKWVSFFTLFIVFILFFAHRGEAAVFSRNLNQGTRGTEVKALQQYLNTHGYPVAKSGAGSKGRETTVFGPATKQALIHFQKDNHITPANGYFGPSTREVINKQSNPPAVKSTTKTTVVKPTPKPTVPVIAPKTPPTTPPSTANPVPTYTLGGMIMGLTSPVTLRNNNIDQITLSPRDNSLFTFPTALPMGTSYAITATPSRATEHCYLMNNTGIVASTNITTIKVACGTNLSSNPLTVAPASGLPTYILTYAPGANGTLTGLAEQHIIQGRNATEIIAVPDTGYHFTTWNDGLTNPTRTDTNITSNQTYTANFAINTYTLTYTPGANGTLSGTTTQTITHGSNATEVTALPNIGYHFANWSDGVLTASRTDLVVTFTQNVTATFTIIPFTCGQTITDDRDGNTYPTVLIGAQCWMAKNLAYLPSVVPSATGDTTNPYYYVYGYQGSNVTTAKAQTNYATYGALYNHEAALTACPNGWHLPTDAEYTTLSTTLGGSAGTKLKATSTVWDGTNTFGFTAKPAGYRLIDGSFYGLGDDASFWSASLSAPNAWYRYLGSGTPFISRLTDDRGYGFSVRCLKNWFDYFVYSDYFRPLGTPEGAVENFYANA